MPTARIAVCAITRMLVSGTRNFVQCISLLLPNLLGALLLLSGTAAGAFGIFVVYSDMARCGRFRGWALTAVTVATLCLWLLALVGVIPDMVRTDPGVPAHEAPGVLSALVFSGVLISMLTSLCAMLCAVLVPAVVAAFHDAVERCEAEHPSTGSAR